MANRKQDVQATAVTTGDDPGAPGKGEALVGERRSKGAGDGLAAGGDGTSGLCDDDMEELVEYTAPVILGKDDQTIFCQVNGENIRIQRGKRVMIKRKFKNVLEQSAEQEMAAFTYMENAQRGSAKAMADLK